DAGTWSGGRAVELRVWRSACGPEQQREPQFVWVEMRCRPLARETGEAPLDGGDRQVVSVMRDVTERKLQEQALVRPRAESRRPNPAARMQFPNIRMKKSA